MPTADEVIKAAQEVVEATNAKPISDLQRLGDKAEEFFMASQDDDIFEIAGMFCFLQFN